ncbi:glycosyltransferase family 2 protein [Gaetbulibacter saemankumensis]|uniref:glycosyltransferase family 2 protein n=1 Tax=Gaetbulibacter saemankumensis TaxID=311208 RepID=UPI0006851A8D|nr:glycosyltransferase family 2 protein [Gaetbulibacter saemankumensis]
MITFNEVNHIDAVLESVNFADEIIVIDSYSNDGTYEKLKSHKNVKTIQREFINFANQRNFALEQAKYEWVLFIDADERIPENLRKEIIQHVNSTDDIVGFMFKRLFFFKQKRIRFSGFQTDTTYRLFKKDFVKYNECKTVHEMPVLNGKSMLLKNKMLHYSFDSASQYKSKMEHYAKLKAVELHQKGKKANMLHFILRPTYKFVLNYFLRLGFLDGKEGLIISYLSAYGVHYRYQKLKSLTKQS